MTQHVINNSLSTPPSQGEPERALLPPSPAKGEVLATASVAQAIAPSVFEFTDYRKFLNAFYEWKKSQNSSYSMSTFIRRAGLGANSRGYLKMIIEGKRNLTPHTVRRFIEAMSLPAKDSMYFENLVYFNQAKTAKDRDYHFGRLSASADGKESQQFDLLKSNHLYHSNWYYVAIRELVGLVSFQEDMGWITSQLRNKISRREAQEALTHLERIGMLRRTPEGKLVQSEPLVKYTGGQFTTVMQKFHGEMLDRAKESLIEDPYEEKSITSVTLCCDYELLPEIKRQIDDFRDQINLKYGTSDKNPDTVFQANFQLFQLTPIKTKRR